MAKVLIIGAGVMGLAAAWQTVRDELGFAAKIPPVQTPIEGLQIADTCFYYPEDRGIAESVRLGRSMARAVPAPASSPTTKPSVRVETAV